MATGKLLKEMWGFRASRARIGRLCAELRLPKNWTLPPQLEIAQFRGDPDVVFALLELERSPLDRPRRLAPLFAYLDMEDLIEASFSNGWTVL